jgi:hypothetical protein
LDQNLVTSHTSWLELNGNTAAHPTRAVNHGSGVRSLPRRDTSSRLNWLAGGRIFPGIHHHARFTVIENAEHYSVTMASDDGTATVHVSGRVGATLPAGSVFDSLGTASEFFAEGSLGYSRTHVPGKFDGLELQCQDWHVQALDVEAVQSSFFEDSTQFPQGSVEFDCALLMRDIAHEWHGREDVCCATATRA